MAKSIEKAPRGKTSKRRTTGAATRTKRQEEALASWGAAPDWKTAEERSRADREHRAQRVADLMPTRTKLAEAVRRGASLPSQPNIPTLVPGREKAKDSTQYPWFARMPDPLDGLTWASLLLPSDGASPGDRALRNAAADLAEVPDLSEHPASTFQLIVDTVARNVRSAILLAELERTDWHFSHVASRLRMSPSEVLRAVKRLLPTEYAQARADGRIRAGRPVQSTTRTRTKP